MSLPRGSRLDFYEIIAPLGAGGMGEVYLAHDQRLNRDVAIKVLPTCVGSDVLARERLKREALAALDHPFICKIFEVAEENESVYFAMEYVRGRNALCANKRWADHIFRSPAYCRRTHRGNGRSTCPGRGTRRP